MNPLPLSSLFLKKLSFAFLECTFPYMCFHSDWGRMHKTLISGPLRWRGFFGGEGSMGYYSPSGTNRGLLLHHMHALLFTEVWIHLVFKNIITMVDTCFLYQDLRFHICISLFSPHSHHESDIKLLPSIHR